MPGPGHVDNALPVGLNQVTNIFTVGPVNLHIACAADKPNYIVAGNGIAAVGITIFNVRDIVIYYQCLFITDGAGCMNIGLLDFFFTDCGFLVLASLLSYAACTRKLLDRFI